MIRVRDVPDVNGRNQGILTSLRSLFAKSGLSTVELAQDEIFLGYGPMLYSHAPYYAPIDEADEVHEATLL